jgi:colicin import membrane protein
LRRLFNQRRNNARRAHVEHGLAEVAAGGGDLAPAAQGALAAAAAAGQAEAAAEAAAEDAEDAELETAHSSPEAAASPPASSTPIPAPTAEDTVELELLPMPRTLVNAFPQAATRSPSHSFPFTLDGILQQAATSSRLPFPLAHLPLAPATATPPLAPVPPPAVQSTAHCPQPCDFAVHPVANDAFQARLAEHIAKNRPPAKNGKGKLLAAEKKRKLAEKAENAAASKAASEASKKQKKQAGESTSAPSHAAKAKAASALAAKDLATSKAALAKAQAALAKQESAIRKITLKAVCAYLIFGDLVLCSTVTWTLYYAPCSH